MAENTQPQQRLRMVNIIGPEGTVIANGVLISPNAEDVTVKNQVGQSTATGTETKTPVSANLKDFLFKKFSSTTESDGGDTIEIRAAGDDYFSIDPSKISILQSWSDYQNLNKKRLVGLYDSEGDYIADFLSGIENLDSTLTQFETTDIAANVGAVKTKYGFAGYVPVTGVDENGDFTTGAPVSADVQAKEFMASFGNSSFWQQIIDREIENKNRLLGVYDANGKVAGYFESTTADLEEVKKIYPNLTNEEVYNLVIDSNKKSLYQRIVDREIEDKNRLLGIYDANGNVVGYFEPTEANIEAIQEVYGLETYDEAYNLAMDLGAKSLYQRLVELNNFWQDLPSEYYRKTEQSGTNIATKYDIDGLSWAAIPIESSGFDFSLLTDGNLIVTSHNQNLDPSSSLEIPESVGRRFIGAIDDFVFSQNTNVSEITIPFGVAFIGEKAFSGCSGLTKVYYDGDIASWCNISFSDMQANPLFYAGKLYIKKSGTNEYELLTNLVIPDSVTKIKDYAFHNCSNLTSVVIGNGVTSIGSYVFRMCTSLTSVTIPNSVTNLGSHVFDGCSSLTSVRIPDRVINIDNYTFQTCRSLTSITIPSGVESIGNYALRIGSSTNKATITFLGTTPPIIQENTFDASTLAEIIVPKGYGSAYRDPAATNWTKFAEYIKEAAE